MLTVVCIVAGTILCLVVATLCLKSWHNWTDLIGAISMIFGVVGIIVIIASVVGIIAVHVNPEGKLAAAQTEKAMLEYRLSQKEYLNDNNIGMTELMKDITEYNSDIIEAQHGLQSPWVNWFYADYVNELTPIILDNSD